MESCLNCCSPLMVCCIVTGHKELVIVAYILFYHAGHVGLCDDQNFQVLAGGCVAQYSTPSLHPAKASHITYGLFCRRLFLDYVYAVLPKGLAVAASVNYCWCVPCVPSSLLLRDWMHHHCGLATWPFCFLQAYGLKRLARGLASSRQGARQGFAAALAATLAHSAAAAAAAAPGGKTGAKKGAAAGSTPLQQPFISAAGVLALLDACLEVTGSMKGSVSRQGLVWLLCMSSL